MDGHIKQSLAMHKRLKILGKEYKVNIDLPGPSDTAAIVLGSVLCGITTLILLYAWLNRNYKPIKAKRLVLTTIMNVASVLWFFGNVPNNGHVERRGIWENCSVWHLWFRILFAYVFFSMLVVRLFVLYRVFKQHRPFQGRVVYIAYIVPLSFNLAISLVGQFLPRKYTIVFDPVNRICVPIKLWSYITLAIGFALWFVLIFYVVMLRNIVSSFNEFRESLIIFAIATLFVIKTVALNITHPMFPLEGTFRLISTIFDVLMANSIILSILVYPVYQCAFHHDDYDIEWRMKLNRDQLEKEYSLTPMDNQIETELITKSITHNDQGYYTNDRQGLSDERIFTPESNIYHNQGGYHHSQ